MKSCEGFESFAELGGRTPASGNPVNLENFHMLNVIFLGGGFVS